VWGLNSKKSTDGTMKYPKDLFSLKEVKQVKKRMEYPKAWKLQRTNEDYVLHLDPKKLSKEYIK